MLQIRQATALDSDAIWGIFHTIVVRGDTYAFDPGISRADALAYWLHPASCATWQSTEECRWYLHPKGQPTWPWFACGQRSIHGLAWRPGPWRGRGWASIL